MIIRTAAMTARLARNTQTEVSDWSLVFKDRIGNEIRVFVSDELLEDLKGEIQSREPLT